MEFYLPMVLNKKTYPILFFIFLVSLHGQVKEKKPRTILFGLIKFDTESEYEDGYWINKWFYAREFAAPISIIPIEIRYGIGANGKSTGSASNLSSDSFKDDPKKIRYESDVSSISQGVNNIWGSSIEVDVGLINLPHYIVGTSWMNVMNGLSYRSSTLFAPAAVPYNEWAATNSNWGDTTYFSPKLSEYLATTHFQYQPFDNWYLNFRYSYGLASALFYSPDKETWNNDLSGSGTSAAGALGIRFILDPGKSNRFTVGMDFRYSYTKIHTINDPNDITPITRFDLSNYGIYLTLSAFYGGNKTSGDKAKRSYYRKDYIESLKTFNKFMSEYPSHSNRHRAEEYIADCEYKIPYQLMEKGLVLERSGKTQKALNMYKYARSRVKNDSIAYNMIQGRIEQIALLWMIEAEKFLNESKYIRAYNLVKNVAEFSDQGKKEIRRFKSWVILGEGKEYQELGFIGTAMEKYAEALEMNQDLVYEVKALQYKAGIQMAKLATRADEFEEVQLAIYSLEFARELSGGIGQKNEQLLLDLKERLKSYDNYKSRALIDKRMNLGRLELDIARSKKLNIGQTLPEVEALLGEPHEKILGNNGTDQEKQLWIYFMDQRSLQLSFQNFLLFKIEEL